MGRQKRSGRKDFGIKPGIPLSCMPQTCTRIMTVWFLSIEIWENPGSSFDRYHFALHCCMHSPFFTEAWLIQVAFSMSLNFLHSSVAVIKISWQFLRHDFVWVAVPGWQPEKIREFARKRVIKIKCILFIQSSKNNRQFRCKRFNFNQGYKIWPNFLCHPMYII